MPNVIPATGDGPTAHNWAATGSETEVALTEDITNIWAAHSANKAVAKRTKKEMKRLRRELGGKLYTMKSILVRTGRGGGWASYLRANKLPRATADRYVREHEAALSLIEEKRLTESISEPTEDDIRRYVQKLVPRLRRVLTTQDAVYYFFDELVTHLGP